MPVLQGLSILVNILRRTQLADDAMGGSQQSNDVIYTNIPARITQLGAPPYLRIQGIESTDNYNCVMQPLACSVLTLRMDDIVQPQSGQYTGENFVITNTQDNPYADLNTDSRGGYRSVSLKYIRDARSIQ